MLEAPRSARQRSARGDLPTPPKTIGIRSGPCRDTSSGRGRIMTPLECAAYANAEDLTFIGSSVEPNEYPGCTRWESGHVEFNDRKGEKETEGCKLGRTGRCVCALK